MSSRSRRTRGSSSSAWRSPPSITSMASPPPSRSNRRTRPRRRARPSAPRPRSTTTCACSGHVSATRSAPNADVSSVPTPCSRSPTRCSRSPEAPASTSPRGACPQCNGFGAVLEYDESLVVPYPERTLREGAIDPWTKPRYENKRRALSDFAKREGIPVDVPFQELGAAQRHKLLHASVRGYKGIFPFLRDLEEKRYKQYIRVFLRQYQTAQECPTCHGTKLQQDSLQVKIAGRDIAEVSELPIRAL